VTYDHWKATNSQDEWLGPEPLERHERVLRVDSGDVGAAILAPLSFAGTG
jgi:hypothetical protein